ncbi:MAG: M10 family metallopeptidase C-terminal domain-containing protein, partial [Pseudomonadota bacterium]|nr:M10 family metallopeptidase C-terminal domain-containing protein [Pseudomonadota bacterium]
MPVISGTAGDDTLNGTSGDDDIYGLEGNDTINAGDGNDDIYTGTGVDTVNAGTGNDYIFSISSGGTFDGGAGYDYYAGNFSASAAPLSIIIGSTIEVSNGTTVINTEGFGIGGGTGDDIFTINSAPSGGTLYAGSGYDTLTYNIVPTSALQLNIEAYNGNQLSGTIGPIGSELTFGDFESVSITGSQLGDSFRVWGNYSGSGLSFNGGAGTDLLTLDFANSTGALSFAVAGNGTVSSSLGSFISFETFRLSGGREGDTLVGGAGNDMLSGGLGADQVDGGAGDDVLNGGGEYHEDDGSSDALAGGSGNDTIYAGFGDNVDGGAGSDSLHLDARAATAGITADFTQLTNGGSITVGGGTLTGIELLGAINATNFADNIVASSTGSGAQMFGWSGNDRLQGSAAGDSIYGGNGNDIIIGGLGQDTLVDDSGEDTFLDTAAGLNGDTISGLSIGDKIIITDANLGSFTFQHTGNVLTYTGGTLYIGSELPGKLVASAVVGGGVQLEVQLPPVATNDQIAGQLTSGYWDGDAHRWNVTQGGTITVNMSMLSSAEQAVARAALGSWADVIGIQFQEVSSGGQILFDNSIQPDAGAYADTNWVNGFLTSAIIHIPSSWIMTYGSQPGSYGFETYLHEIGHALGLGHPGNYNGTADYVDDAMFANDSIATTVMSYFDISQSYYFALQHFSNYHAGTPMQADIIAMQSLYGLSTSTRTGDTVYGFNTNAGSVYQASGAVTLTIFDNGGIDTLDYSNVGLNQLINLNSETFSSVNGGVGNLGIARGTIIENAIGGSGADQLIGNSVGNQLSGAAGNDTITGNAGNDTLIGGAGADVLDGGDGNDSIVYDAADIAAQVTGGAGTDTLVVNGSLAPTSFNLVAQEFELAEVGQADSGGNPWASITQYYNSSWTLLQQVTINDNGSRFVRDYDHANSLPTAQVEGGYDALGRLSSFDQLFDNGTRTFINLDEASNQSWTQDWFQYDALGRLSSEDVLYDNGTRTFINLDEAGANSWTQDWFSYDAQGRLSSEDVIYDNGRRTFINLDQDSSQSWNQAWFSYDNLGRLDTQDV